MVFINWTATTNAATSILDAIIKYAGASSWSAIKSGTGTGPWATLTHNTFSETKAQVIAWGRTQAQSNTGIAIYHSSYGNLVCTTPTDSTWYRFKASFWYDTTTNIKWGRVEIWNGSTWAQIGGGDTNFGTGSPSVGSIALKMTISVGLPIVAIWFDEVEVYS